MKIALFKESHIFAKLIQWFTRGNYYHSAIILKDESVIDARPWKGVTRRNNIFDCLKKNTLIDIFEVEVNADQEKIIENFLINQLGKKYDWWNVFGFVLYKSEEGRRNYNKWFCSELTFAAFSKASIFLLDHTKAFLISPTVLSYSPKLKFYKRLTKNIVKKRHS